VDSMEASIEKMKDTISEYERLLAIIGNEPGAVCIIPKTEISRLYGKSYTGTLKKLGFLERYGLIEKVAGGYVRTEKTFMRDTPMALIPKIVLLIRERPELYNSYKQQAELLSVHCLMFRRRGVFSHTSSDPRILVLKSRMTRV
jgi:hypothetical protein